MKNFSIILSSVAVVLAATSSVYTAKHSSEGNVSQAAIEEALKANPKMVIDALQAYQDQQREEQRKAAEEALAKYTPQINSSENAPFVGPEDAKVTVVFKPLAFVDPENSHYQAQAGLAVFKQGKFAEFYKAVMAAEGRMNKDAIDGIARGLDIDFDKYKADVESDDVNNDLSEIADLSSNIQVNGVPTVIINGKHIQTMNADDLQEAINAAK